MKLSDYVTKFIASLNVKDLFLLPGGGCMHLLDSFGSCKEIKKICCLHEQGAVIAADAFSQYTGNIGVALVTTGPGSTNAITGVAGSWIDSIPLIMISGQAKRQDMIGDSGLRQRGIQEVDIISLVKPITKYAITVMEPESIKYHLEKIRVIRLIRLIDLARSTAATTSCHSKSWDLSYQLKTNHLRTDQSLSPPLLA